MHSDMQEGKLSQDILQSKRRRCAQVSFGNWLHLAIMSSIVPALEQNNAQKASLAAA